MSDTSRIFQICISTETVVMYYTWVFHVKVIVHLFYNLYRYWHFPYMSLLSIFYRYVRSNWFCNTIIDIFYQPSWGIPITILMYRSTHIADTWIQILPIPEYGCFDDSGLTIKETLIFTIWFINVHPSSMTCNNVGRSWDERIGPEPHYQIIIMHRSQTMHNSV